MFGIVALAQAGLAHAQGADTSAVVLEEITVTAEKRESTAQKTPIAMTVFDQAALQRNGVGALEDLAVLAPGVGFGKNSANMIVTVRGVSSRDTGEIGDPAISISQDGFYIQRANSLSDALYDLERVEVLRGPQGTLYGRNATGGAINFITAKPTDQLEARGAVGFGNYNLRTVEGMVNVPLSDKVAARASVFVRQHDGYRSNEKPATPGDDADVVSGRLHLLYMPTDELKILLTGQYTDIGGVGPTMFGIPLVRTGTGAIDTSFRPDLNQDGTPHGSPDQFLDQTLKTLQWNAQYDFTSASLVYLGGFRDGFYRQLRDLDGMTNSSTYILPQEKAQDWSHELRLVSNGAGPFTWQFGGYSFRMKNDLLSKFQTYAVANPPQDRFIFDYFVRQKSNAAFAHGGYQITDEVKLEAGVRYSKDEKSRAGFQNLSGGDPSLNQNSDSSSSSTHTTYDIGANWQLTPQNLLYVKYGTGYKAGGFSTLPGVGTFDFDPETITAYEIGAKNRFLGNRLQLNLSGYYYDYADQQVTVRDDAVGLTRTLNAGKSEIYGTEIELVVQATPADRLDAFSAYLHAQYKDLCTVRNVNGVCTTDFAGNVPPQAPEWQFGGGYEHEFMLPWGTLTARAQTHIESKSYQGIENFPFQEQDGYTRSDVMLTYKDEGNRWSLQGYVRNLEDEVVITSAVASSLFGTYTYGISPPRTYGATVTVNW
jgi:iron complex outermembrane receptor protein